MFKRRQQFYFHTIGEIMSHPINGRIINYRIGIKTQTSNVCLIQLTDVNSASQSGPLIGRKVVWKGENKDISGKIIGFHGKNGVVRVKFKRGLPGQAIGTTVQLAA
jgi:large subunit ribosomal protein L35Ae